MKQRPATVVGNSFMSDSASFFLFFLNDKVLSFPPHFAGFVSGAVVLKEQMTFNLSWLRRYKMWMETKSPNLFR